MPGPDRSPYPNCNGLYVNAGEKVLIDQGGSVSQARSIKNSYGISRICLTHWHEDHALSACALADIPLYVPEADRAPIESRQATHERSGITDEVAARQIDTFYDGMGYHHRRVDGVIAPEQVIDLDGTTMVALHTPGHTAGHTCYWFPSEGVLVLGDYDLTRAGPVTPDADSDVRKTYKSLSRLEMLPVRRAAAAHGRGWFEGDEYRNRIASYTKTLDERLKTILDLVRSGDDSPRKLARHFRTLFNMPVLPGYEAWASISGEMLIRPLIRYLQEEGDLRETATGRYEAA